MNSKLLEQIRALRLGHMSNALEQQWSQPMTYTSLSFEERLSLLLEHELLQREVSKVNRLRRHSRLRLDAQPSQLDYRPEIGTCRLNGIDPEAYLRYILSVLPEWPSNKVAELLP